mmetsp:Transcript_4319/g.7054  ORF Transcript_4319/g.7054 Transcript_4319/m.7054 type:complete len:128 (-) Transcript_4319:300-683(-)
MSIAKTGCISVSIDGHFEHKQPFGGTHTRFKIRVKNIWSTTTVSRRYSDFVALDSKIRPKVGALADLPPKAYWKKTIASITNDRTFMNHREHELGKFLEAVVSWDPALRNPDLREFLGVRYCTADGR